MAKVTYVDCDRSQTVVDVPHKTSVMQAAVAHGIEGIVAECGGNLMCATCHVYVEADSVASLPEMRGDEDELLDCVVSERRPDSRLSCQLVMDDSLDGMVVELPAEQV
jgi:2Fe-2S ferredoxin